MTFTGEYQGWHLQATDCQARLGEHDKLFHRHNLQTPHVKFNARKKPCSAPHSPPDFCQPLAAVAAVPGLDSGAVCVRLPLLGGSGAFAEAVFGSQTALTALVESIGYLSEVPVTHLNETVIMLVLLALIDVVMISNLLIMVIVGGYETFVSRMDLEGHRDQPEWLDPSTPRCSR